MDENENNRTTSDLINIDNGLLNIEAQDTVEAIMGTRKPNKKNEKWIKFHLYRMFGVPTQLAAKMVGYNSLYGYKLVEKYRNNTKWAHILENFINSMPDDYKNICRMRLPAIAEIEGGALQKYKEKPELAIRQPQLLKQIKQGAGIDLGESSPSPKGPTINIEELKLIHQSLLPDHPEVEAIEGEILKEDDG